MLWRRPILLVGSMVGLLSLPSSGLSQDLTSGTMRVVVKDDQGLPVPGANITAATPRGPVSGVSDARGLAVLPFLEPARHDVTVTLGGFATVTHRAVAVRVNSITEITVTLRPAGLQETVDVVDSTPALDRLATSAGEDISPEMFQAIPVRRNFMQVVALAPGVADPGRVGSTNPSVSGASGLENAYYIDGVNITNTGYGGVGAFSPTFGSLGTNVNFDFVQEVQVKTGGAPAEFGAALGGVVTVVTKSGSNTVRGSLFGFIERGSLEGDRTQPNAALVVPGVEDQQNDSTDFGFAVGGPILKDKLFWFAALNPTYTTLARSTPTDFVTLEEGGILSASAFPLARLGAVDVKSRSITYSGKLSYQVRPMHRIDLTAFGDPSRTDFGPIRESALLNPNGETTGFSDLDFGSQNLAARYNGIMGRLFAELVAARAFSKSVEGFPPENNLNRVTDLTRGGLAFGGIGQRSDNESENLQFGGKLTWAAGRHQLKGGYLLEDMSFQEDFSVVGPRFSVRDASGNVRETFGGAQVQQFSETLYRVTFADLTNSNNRAEAKYHSMFVQDTWTVTDRLTVNAGLRAEREDLSGSAGVMNIPWGWAPRLGMTLDPQGNGKSKLWAHWGRYYQKVPGTLATKLLSEGTKLTRADYFDAALTQQVPGAPVQTGAAFTGLVDPDIKGMFQDELLGGIEIAPRSHLSLGARVTYRNLGRIVEDISNLTIPFLFTGRFNDFSFIFTNPGPGTEKFLIQDPLNQGSIGEPERIYKALELTMRRRLTDGWQALASYRLSSLEGNYEGFFGNDYPSANPGANPSFDFPAQVADPLTQPDPILGYSFISGPLPTDRRHSVKLFGSYSFGARHDGLTVGLGFDSQSGAPISSNGWNPAYNRAEFPESPRGSLGRTDTLWRLDLHADYPFRVGDSRSLRLIADVFNLTNAQNVVNVEQRRLVAANIVNPNFLKPTFYQAPRRVRLGVRFDF